MSADGGAPVKDDGPDTNAPVKKSGVSAKGAFYRQMRLWHAYLSAFAFIALMFFSLTGMLLNHQDWFMGARPSAQDREITLSAADLAAAQKAADPHAALAQAVEKHIPLKGAFKSGETLDGEAVIRLEGATGNSDLTVNLDTGATLATVQPNNATTILHELHRGTHSGGAWRLMIDVTAILFMALSLVGYVLFFSLRFRLATSLILTGVSLIALLGLFFFLVP